MLREHGERSKGVVHHRVRRKLRLIGNGISDPTACEAVGDKRGKASLVQLARPHAGIEADTARAMHEDDGWQPVGSGLWYSQLARYHRCLLYTSDAADDLLCVDLGGRRIIKKKKKI